LWNRYTYVADRHHQFKPKRKYIGVALSVHDAKPVEAALDAARTSQPLNLVLSGVGAVFLVCLVGIPCFWLGSRMRANEFATPKWRAANFNARTDMTNRTHDNPGQAIKKGK